MINKVFQYAQKYHMFEENDYVVAGVSGGADSVCLLFMLLEIQKRIPIKIHVVHINHMIRQEAGEDAAYVKSLCDAHQLPFTLVKEDVSLLAAQRHISTEEAGREVRYGAFWKVLQEYAQDGKGKIAIAHNANDCSETFLFHLFRGSGLKGLTGIRPVRDAIVRPILCLDRAEIEAYLEKNKIAYCIDQTNLEDNYTRNKIRHHILPYVEKEISHGAGRHIAEACSLLQEANELIESLTDDMYDKYVVIEEEKFHIHHIEEINKTLRPYVIHKVLAQAAGSRKNVESVHINQVIALLEKQCGRQMDLPYQLEAVREYDGICIRKKARQESPFFSYAFCKDDYEKLEQGEQICIALQNDCELLCRLIPCNESRKAEVLGKNNQIKPYTKWLDYGKIKDNIVVRNRKEGDFITMNLLGQHKSLKSFFIDEKVPKEQRDQIYLVTEGSHVLWIVGKRMSAYYKVSKDTENMIEFLYRGGVENG